MRAVLTVLGAVACSGGESSVTARDAAPPVPPPDVGFTALDAERTGVAFNNELPASHEQINVFFYQYFYNGAGVAIGDINGDDRPDLYFTGNLVANRLYLNEGNLSFQDITETSGVAGRRGWATGATMVDIDADGDLDIYVSRAGPIDRRARANELFVNDGTGRFTEQAEAFGLADTGYTTHAAFFDYDLDGDLDAFVLNHPKYEITKLGGTFGDVVGVRDLDAGDRLYRNDGGTFVDVSEAAGIVGNPIGYALSASVGDLTGDGWPDLYVANDFVEKDYFYVNQGDGTFVDRMKEAMPHISLYSMGADIADIDHDQHLDLVVGDMAAPDNYRQKTLMLSMNVPQFRRQVRLGFHYQYSYNTLQRNNGDGTFSDIAQLAGVARSDWTWAALFLDFDNDGWQDLFFTNGRRKDSGNVDYIKLRDKRLKEGAPTPEVLREILDVMPDGFVPNKAFRNRGDLTFEDVSARSGLAFRGASNGAAYGDLDGDGDLDLVVNNTDAPAGIFENRAAPSPGGHFLKVRFEGPEGNPFGIGARVTVHHGETTQLAEHYWSRGYQSSVEPGLHFGLGDAPAASAVRVRWPDGKVQELQDVAADRALTVRYADAGPAPAAPAPPPPMIEEITESSGLRFTHSENPHDDLKREILLPYETSKLGPALAVGDVQGDGLDDVYLGGAIGQAGRLFTQRADGRFTSAGGPWTAHVAQEDVAAVFFDADADGDLDLYVGSGGNEPAPGDALLQDRLYVNDGLGNFIDATAQLPRIRTSTGVVAAGDADGDGDQDLFVGGRVVPGQYPRPPRSYLLLQQAEGRFVDATADQAPGLVQPGMVTAAAFTDLEGDGDLDLAVAGEWMPVVFATNEGGRFSTAAVPDSEGWWRSLTLVGERWLAGNVGLNLKFRASPDTPFDVYASDFDESGSLDIVLSHEQDGERYPVRGRECSSLQMPFIAEKFETYDAFGKATLRDVYGEGLEEALHLRAKTFASAWLVRDGDGFRREALPNLAQIGVVQGAVVHDVDGDGIEDVVVAGNLEKTEVETPRIDGGTGLVLLADGSGGFEPVRPDVSGFSARGDVKRLAKLRLAGGAGFVVARNDGPASLYRFTQR